MVHSMTESRGCVVVSAYLMASRKQSPTEAFTILELALPLFSPNAVLQRTLDLFYACDYMPTADHPIVKQWIAEPGPGATTDSLLVGSTAGPPRSSIEKAAKEGGEDGKFYETLNRIYAAGP